MAAAAAAPNEIKIFTDELAQAGEHTLEVHANKASRAGPESQTTRNPLQLMPEYSYGIHANWEASLQLPFSFWEGTGRGEGYRAELQYVAPHDQDAGLYWGFNLELAYVDRQNEPTFWNGELIPILGYRRAKWHVVANPGIERALSGDSRATKWQPAAKLAYRALGSSDVGFEYYADTGPLRNRLPRDEQSRVLYLTWDGELGKSALNAGIGRGLTDASDRWVAKMIYELRF